MYSLQPTLLSVVSLIVLSLVYTSSAQEESQWSSVESNPGELWEDEAMSGIIAQAEAGELDVGEPEVTKRSFIPGSQRLPSTYELIRLLRRELNMLRKRQSLWSEEVAMSKKYKPSGFMGSRGKRVMPDLESLLLSRYLQDAKWKRQPPSGFHGSRG